jgi:hypothetical protein
MPTYHSAKVQAKKVNLQFVYLSTLKSYNHSSSTLGSHIPLIGTRRRARAVLLQTPDESTLSIVIFHPSGQSVKTFSDEAKRGGKSFLISDPYLKLGKVRAAVKKGPSSGLISRFAIC